MPRYLVPIDLSNNEIKNAVIQNLSTAPANPVKGLFYFNTTDNTLYVYNGTEWKDALSVGVVNYNNLSNKPITNISSSTTLSSAGVYKIVGSNVVATVNGTNVSGNGTLIIYDGSIASVIKSDSVYLIKSNGGTTNYVKANSSITGATKTKITYDSKGLVTNGEDLASSDIPDLSSTYINVNRIGAANGVAGLDSNSKISSSQVPDLSGTYIPTSQKAAKNGVASLDANKKVPTSQLPDLSSTYINVNQIGAANGIASLDSSGQVPSEQLPSYVDDVIEGYYYNSKFYKEAAHTTEITGEQGKIYVDIPNNKSYRYSGSAYVLISNPIDIASKAEAETGTNNTKMMTPLRTKQAFDVHIANYINTYESSTKYTTIIGDGSATSYTVTHNLNTEYPIVQLYEISTKSQVLANITSTNANKIKIDFLSAPTSNNIKVLVMRVEPLASS